ncbi:MAG: M15 family metallopeptidase [Spirochaetaceae bacterium]|nr:M15 family metallopeptidase [Spirochaetaceae bacterium]
MIGIFIRVFLLLSFLPSDGFSEEQNIHPAFNMTRNQLAEIITRANSDIQERILNNPRKFLELADAMLSQPEELFYLVDKNNAISREQAPKEIVKPYDYGISVTRNDRTVSKLIIDHLKNLTDSAKEAGLDIVFASGYRSYEYQEMIYKSYVEKMGQKEADRVSARPGTSQHQLGTAVDFGSISDEYALTEEGKWLYGNAGTFGFSLSYPKDYEQITGYKWECWHYRFITCEGVAMERLFFSNIQQLLLEFWQTYRDDLIQAWRK